MLCAYMPLSKEAFKEACCMPVCVSIVKEACCMPVCLCRKRSFSIINSHHNDLSHHRFPPKRTKWIEVLIS